MRLALDTNAYSDLQKGSTPTLYRLSEEAEEVAIPFVVVAELRAGFSKGALASKNNQVLESFLATDLVTVLYANEATTTLYAELWAELERKGKPIPTNDVWIAALCLQYGCSLATNDRHFAQVPLLQTLQVN